MTDLPKVLLSAYACEPGKGSEPGVGWNWVRELARFNHVWVITRLNNRPTIEDALRREPIANAHWTYVDLPPALKFWKRGARGVFLYYYLWQIAAYRLARRLHDEVQFDLIHHLTFGKYSTPSFLSLLNPPFVWGPLGGAEFAPNTFRKTFGWRGNIHEALRDAADGAARIDPFLRITARRTALALAKTNDTANRLRQLGCRRVTVCSEVGIPTNEIESMARSSSSSGRQFKLLSIGRLLHWKGFHLALAAFARLRQLLPEAEYTVIGEGPERSRLVTLTEQFNLGSSARMLGSLSREKTLAELSHTDVLVHPSLHDSGGWVCVEAMSSGKPVICLDLGGPSLEVCAETGFKVPARDPEQAIQDMADAMLRLALDRELRISMGEAGRAHAKEQFALENKGPEMARFYAEVLDRSKPSD